MGLSDFFTPPGFEIVETAWNIQPAHQLNATFARLFRLKGPVTQDKPTSLDAWKAAITAGSVATRKQIAPVLKCMDKFSGGTAVPVGWRRPAPRSSSSSADVSRSRKFPDDDHLTLPDRRAPDARAWLKGLF